MGKTQLMSVVAPMFNEEKGIPAFIAEVIRYVEPLGYPFEIVLVDDGSKDKTFEVVKSVAQKDSRVKVIRFSRNFGQQAALLAGLKYARGDFMVMLDSDLQHPPELIPQLVKKYEEGFEVVNTVRKFTEKQAATSALASKTFYWIFNKLSYMPIIPGALDFRLVTRRVNDVFCSLNEQDRFNRGLFTWIGFDSATVDYVANERFAGQSSYNFRTLLRLALSSITSFSGKPLRLSLYLGVCTLGIIFLYIAFVVVDYFLHGSIKGWSGLFFSVAMLGSVQLISIGVLGEYIFRIYNEVKRRPQFVVDKEFNVKSS